MPFGSFFKKIFKKTAKDVAEKYVGEDAAAAVDDVVDEGFKQLNVDENLASIPGAEGMETVIQKFTSGQQSGLGSLFSVIGGNADAIANHCQGLGLDPALVKGVLGMLTGGGGGAAAGGAAGGSGFGIGELLNAAQSLTKGGGTGGGGLDGFLQLIQGGGGSAGNSNNILQILIGLAKSFFAMQMGKNKAMQDWSDAGAKKGKNDDNFNNWGNNVVDDLVFPGKKDKDIINDGDDPADKPTGGKDGVNKWFDKHPEIGKMQKDVFDDIFDTTDEDDEDRLIDDPTPLIPTPKGFESDCSILDQASILFLNSRVLLDLRKEWRFLYSFKTNAKDFSDLYDRVELKGPTIVLIETTEGHQFGAFTSTSWADTEGGWIGNGDSFVFAIKPKMAVFYSTGKDDNIMHCSKEHGFGLGGAIGKFGLSINPDLSSGTYHEEVDTFDLPALFPEEFEIAHLEVWGLGPETDPDRERAKLHVRKPNLQIRSGGVDMDDLLGQIS